MEVYGDGLNVCFYMKKANLKTQGNLGGQGVEDVGFKTSLGYRDLAKNGGKNESLSYIKQRQPVAIRGSGTGGQMRDWGHKLLGQQNYLHGS